MEQTPQEQLADELTETLGYYEHKLQESRLAAAIEAGHFPKGTQPEDLSPEDRAYYLGEDG